MPGLPDPLAGYQFRPGSRGPRTSLTREMIPIIAEWLARTGVKRIAAAKARTTEDCLGKWLSKGLDATRRRKSSIYTELLDACEDAWAHRTAYLIELGERTVVDRHTNPRFLTWLLAVTSPKQFTVAKEPAQAQSNGLGPAFELVTPEAAAASVHAKLMRFLEEDDKRNGVEAPAAAEPAPESEGSPAGDDEESR
jgi:hypothetical protein